MRPLEIADKMLYLLARMIKMFLFYIFEKYNVYTNNYRKNNVKVTYK